MHWYRVKAGTALTLWGIVSLIICGIGWIIVGIAKAALVIGGISRKSDRCIKRMPKFLGDL